MLPEALPLTSVWQ